jgi:hypothetical protein
MEEYEEPKLVEISAQTEATDGCVDGSVYSGGMT